MILDYLSWLWWSLVCLSLLLVNGYLKFIIVVRAKLICQLTRLLVCLHGLLLLSPLAIFLPDALNTIKRVPIFIHILNLDMPLRTILIVLFIEVMITV